MWLLGVVVGTFSSAADAQVRSMGGGLQLGGLWYVVHGLTRRGAAHKVPISWQQLTYEFRKLRGKTHAVGRSVTLRAETGSIAVTGDAATVRVSKGTLEGRVDELERLQREDRDAISSVDARLKTERSERAAAIVRERNERESAVQLVQQKIKDMEIGNIYFEWVGVLWILVGIICATWASELTSILSL